MARGMVDLQVDMADFSRTLREYLKVCKDSLAEILNKKMLFIARGALRLTPRADRSEIERSLGVTGYGVIRSRKTGKTRRGKSMISQRGADRAFRIVQARRKADGLKPLPPSEMDYAVRKLINWRLRAVGSLAAGWIRSIRVFSKVTGAFNQFEGKTRVKHPGRATPATEGWDPVAELEYEVLVDNKNNPHIDPRVEQALSQAFTNETASMEAYITERLQRDIDRMAAR